MQSLYQTDTYKRNQYFPFGAFQCNSGNLDPIYTSIEYINIFRLDFYRFDERVLAGNLFLCASTASYGRNVPKNAQLLASAVYTLFRFV